LPKFKGAQARVRCFAHILNLIVKVSLDYWNPVYLLKLWHRRSCLNSVIAKRKRVLTRRLTQIILWMRKTMNLRRWWGIWRMG
jgi:hypothetical protein